MLKKTGLLLSFFMCLIIGLSAQSDAGKLKGKVTDDVGEPVPYATVKVIQNGIIKGGANTDDDGNYSIVQISPGKYQVEVSFAGQEKSIPEVNIITGKTKTLDISMSTDVQMEEVQIYEPIEFDQTTTIESFDKNQIKESGYRDINSVVAIAAGASVNESTGGVNMRGQRSTGTVYFIDGVKVRGNPNMPQKSIEQISVITGGTPAEYGDLIGGAVSITTAGPSYKLSGGGEVLTSQLFPNPYVGLDPYGYTLAGVNLSGPIVSKYDSVNEYKKPILGFMFAGEVEYQKDDGASFVPIPYASDEVKADISENPLQLDETGNFFINRANFLTEDDITYSKIKRNNSRLSYRASGRLDFQPSDNIIVKAGMTFQDFSNNEFSLGRTILGHEGNSLYKTRTYRGWLRFQQIFPGSKDSKLKNMFYMVQADYNFFGRQRMNGVHQENLFDYGYIGSFGNDIQEIYGYYDATVEGHNPNGQISDGGYYGTVGYAASNLSFDASGSKNPLLANYNSFILDWVAKNGLVNPFTGQKDYSLFNSLQLSNFGGLRNGESPSTLYSLFNATGSDYGGFAKWRYDQLRFSGQASGELKGHNFKFGFEFEQRTERYFGVNARGLWTRTRQLANRHISALDENPDNWNLVTVDGVFQDTVHIPLLASLVEQSAFDRNLRSQLGLNPDGNDFILTDNYDPSTYSLGLFSADELLNDGNSYVNYFGYDYQGNLQAPVSTGKFFDDEANRPMNAFRPTYIAGYIQDKFELEDIIFNIGLRVDRFDANQPVLKDAFSLYPTKDVSEIRSSFPSIPSSIPDNYVPYGTDTQNPSEIVGFRDPSTNIWYDRNGAPVSSTIIRTLGGGTVKPILKTSNEDVGMESFKDYDPQTMVMPRLSFSFPISGEAVFFAHYDVLTQRPGQTGNESGSLLAGQVTDYYFLANNPTGTVTNPSLRPEKTIDYEVGFKQRLNDFMALSVSAFYREMRDLIQRVIVPDAYPYSYNTYANQDFGTVKGFTASLNMVRKKNIRFNLSYTLQFAAGTGSSFSSARNAINLSDGFTAIRSLMPLDFDQRHRFTGNIDYRFNGDDKGPSIKFGKADDAKRVYPLANFGVSTNMFLISGTPYSVNSLPNSADVQTGINQNINLDGSPNGSRLPWNFKLDLKVDKSFVMGGGIKKDKEGNSIPDSYGNPVKKRSFDFNVYLQALNLLNSRNIVNVYKTTGLADDDGYLVTGVGQQAINAAIDGESFRYLYGLKSSNPSNYTAPRRLRLGVVFSF